MDLKSLTPLAEFVDVIYTRCATELSPIEGLSGRIELRPPTHADHGTGDIRIKGVMVEPDTGHQSIIETRCPFNAITEGHSVGLNEMTLVADVHIDNFKSKVVSA